MSPAQQYRMVSGQTAYELERAVEKLMLVDYQCQGGPLYDPKQQRYYQAMVR